MNQLVEINGMTCGGCVKNVEKALQTIDGVEIATVSLKPPHAILQTDHTISDEQLKSVLSEAGNYSLAGKSEDNNPPKKSGGSCCC